MNAVGTLSHSANGWYAINWRQVNRHVRRLQVRIAKAMKEGRRGKVHALRRILVRSLAGARWAVRQVTEAKGKKTPGIDGIVWTMAQQKQAAIAALQRGRYRAQPLRRLYLPKANGKKRPLGIPCFQDRARQALHALALDPIAETMADANSYGFRRERSPADAIEQCFIVLARKNAARWILEGDIHACFDEIQHSWLLDHTPMDRTLLRQWLKAGYLERGHFHTTTAGTPQGSPISPTLCNLTLDGLETVLKTQFRGHKVNLIRFADDFIVTGDSKALLEHQVQPVIEIFLHERGLRLSATKTRIVSMDEGFDFLGQNLRKYRGKLIIQPAQKAVKSLLTQVRTTLKQHPSVSAATIIEQLNPVIRGWTQYHRHVCSKTIFGKIDFHIHHAVWQWAVRRHRNKPKRWIRQRYFTTQAGNHWVFTAINSKQQLIQLFRAATLPIQRHIKIRAQANPYDPDHERYFEQRLMKKWASGSIGSRRAQRLWQSQQGHCTHCGHLITEDGRWEIHHRIPRHQGGPDTLDNLILLHRTCHRQLHARSVIS